MSQGVSIDSSKVDAVLNWLSPKNVFKICSFLGLAVYYHRLMKDFSSIASYLTKLTYKGVRFVCDECEQAFQLLKVHLTLAPIFMIPKRGVGYVVYCDASLNCLGCILMQEG